MDGGADEVGEEYTSCDGEVFGKEGFPVSANVPNLHSVAIESQRWLVRIQGRTCTETTINLRVCERPDGCSGSGAAVRWSLTGHIANLSALPCLSSHVPGRGARKEGGRWQLG